MRALFDLEVERRKKVILPVLIETVTLPLFLRDKKYADFSKDYSQALNELLLVFEVGGPSHSHQLETVRCDVEVDIIREDGSLVRPVKRQLLRARVDGVSQYLDVCSADGAIRDIKVSPGRINTTWVETGLVYIESIFPIPLLVKGQEIEHMLDSFFVDAFIEEPTWFWEQRQFHPSKDLQVLVVFPVGRPPKEYTGYEKRDPDRFGIDDHVQEGERDGRKTLRMFLPTPGC